MKENCYYVITCATGFDSAPLFWTPEGKWYPNLGYALMSHNTAIPEKAWGVNVRALTLEDALKLVRDYEEKKTGSFEPVIEPENVGKTIDGQQIIFYKK